MVTALWNGARVQVRPKIITCKRGQDKAGEGQLQDTAVVSKGRPLYVPHFPHLQIGL